MAPVLSVFTVQGEKQGAQCVFNKSYLKTSGFGVTEMAHCFRVLVALPEDTGLLPNVHVGAHSRL